MAITVLIKRKVEAKKEWYSRNGLIRLPVQTLNLRFMTINSGGIDC